LPCKSACRASVQLCALFMEPQVRPTSRSCSRSTWKSTHPTGGLRRGLAYYLAGAVVMRRELPDRRVEFQVLGQHEDSYGVIFDFGPNYKRAECLCARQTSASRHQVGAQCAGASGSLLTRACACTVTEGLVQAHHRLSGDGRLRQRDRPGVGSAYAGSERGDRVGLL